ncbi:MAG: 30S ribosomal protein S17 [Deltaproteobacteria bacterium]|nr:30S ribosomal protein S17 [Deltaproteobacteria bacterium]
MQSNKKLKPFSMLGVVISDKMNKTRIVAVEKVIRHPKYQKMVKKIKKYKVHDEGNKTHINDIVEIVLTRPLSKGKNWRISNVVGQVSINAHAEDTL